MSGIGAGHNKYETCDKCPDRCADPNCHTTCRGYLYRKEKFKELREWQRYERDGMNMTEGCRVTKNRYKHD